MAQYQLGVPRSDGETFCFVFTFIWQEEVAKIFKVPRAPHNVNSARAITWSVGVTIYYIIFPSTSPGFTRQNNFEKN